MERSEVIRRKKVIIRQEGRREIEEVIGKGKLVITKINRVKRKTAIVKMTI